MYARAGEGVTNDDYRAASPTFSRANRFTVTGAPSALRRRRKDVGHGHLRIADRRLVGQNDLLIVAAELAFDDLVDHSRGLAGALHLGAVDGPLLLEDLDGHGRARDVCRAGRGDLHRDLLHQRRELFPGRQGRGDAAELDLHADLATHVNVLADIPVAGIADEAGDRHVLAELPDALGHAQVHRPFRILQPALGGRVARTVDCGQHVTHQRLEVVGARDEIGLAVDLHENALRAIGGHELPDEPSDVARPAFLAALASPFFRKIVVASSKFPPASSSAVLQSIMPAPVWSRSFFTSLAVIVAMVTAQ